MPPQGPAGTARYVFADCLLDTQLLALYRAGQLISLRPKAFHVLRYLVEHRDHPVTKDELCANVWPAQFISDAAIEGCIKSVRQAIGDSGRAQKLIQTRRGYGYRFVGVVEEQEAALAAHPTLETLAQSNDGTDHGSTDRRRPSTPIEDVARSAPASALPVTTHGERKLVTLLGCTPAHAAALVARGGLDALHRQMRALHAIACHQVSRYGGTILSVAGTRLLAMFGAPLGQEDHARRALLAAWALQQQLASGTGDGGEAPLTACVALHTGLVVMGGIAGSEGPTLVGDLPLAVEALQGHATSGALVCSYATARLVRNDVQLEEVAPVMVPGQAEPLRTYKIAGVHSPDTSCAHFALRPLSPFVGRQQELAALHTILTQTLRGRGHTVGVVGEPGIGKSRLLREFRQELPLHGPVRYLEAHCLSYGSATPYLPVLELLSAHCGITPADNTDAISAKVSASIDTLGLAQDGVTPYLLHLLGVDAADRPVTEGSPDTR